MTSPRFDRLAVVHGALVLFVVAIIGKAAQVQVLQADRWRANAARQQVAGAALPAPRGTITDASGRVLVESRELVRLRVAPREVRDRTALRQRLVAAGVPKAWAARGTDSTRRWVELPGDWLPSDVARVTATRGVHAVPTMQRVLSASDAVRRIVGRVGADGVPVDGLEVALDTLLRGTVGSTQLLRDARGGRMESPRVRGVAARAGHDVTLTLNYELQAICERALADAVRQMGATGGDIVVTDPHTGAVLALASERADARATAATGLAEPFEPGSTVKPFVAAALLASDRARVDEVVNTENGEWTIHGRTVHDVHRAASLSLRDVIRWSSNVGIIKLAQRLTPQEQYEVYRDLGFGAPTGVPYPAEAAGTLRTPARWTKQSAASLAMGYELATTPLQLAAAYGAIANGGELLEPALVREVRDPDGAVRYRHARRVVRRVMPESVASTVREMLASVVDSGTGTAADLASFAVGGKSGTVRRIERGRGYAAGHYNAVFAGIFPIEAPQFVIVVKVDNPQGVYYGGKTAAPISRTILQAALAARDAALDRGALAARVRPAARDAYARASARDSAAAPVPNVSRAAGESAAVALRPVPVLPPELRRDSAGGSVALGPARAVRVVVDLSAARASRDTPSRVVADPPRAVPVVDGLPVRDAFVALHRAGFRARLADGRAPNGAIGRPAGRTAPAAGALATPGAVVTVFRGQ